MGATVQAAVYAALPTPTPTPLPDIPATVSAGIAATQAAAPTATPTPIPTPDIDATVEARMAAAIVRPTATPEPPPTAMTVPSPTPTLTATPAPVPTATRQPTPTATSLPTRKPILTKSPTAALREMVKQVRPSVVRIESRSSTGSGVIFETQGSTAYIITNHHVVEDSAEASVTVNDSTAYRGAVLGTDRVRDLAVVRICCGSFRALTFGDASGLEPGDEVVAIGYALGLSGQATITRGIVSAMRYDPLHQSDVIQTDAAINPGNSGGPMLSTSGEMLGINTFRIEESGSGRVTEGLGFAISEKTVQGRIPTLKAASTSPTPTPTRSPQPTPSADGGYGFGPISGELRHNPSDGFIKTHYVDISVSDLILRATFTNPYSAASNSWDYGFIVRDSGAGDSSQFLQVVVASDSRWSLEWRDGSSSESELVGEGRIANLDIGAGGQNSLWLAVFGQRGLLFVNGEYISSLDLSDVTQAGAIAAITGGFAGDEVTGAVTRFEDFQIFPLQKRHGPASGSLQKEPGFIAEYNTEVWARDVVAEAEFTRPQGSDWDYGFVIRSPGIDSLEVIGVSGGGGWFHKSYDAEDAAYRDIAEGFLEESGGILQNGNHLLLLAFGDTGLFFLNDALIAGLDLSHNLDYGTVSAMGDFFLEHQGSPSFSNFNVWTP